MVKTISVVILVIAVVLLAIHFLLPGKTLYQKVLNDLKIEHVFNIPSMAYGPGSVYIYAKKAGYIGVCLPWNVIGCGEAEYAVQLRTFEIPAWQQVASREEKIKFTDYELKAVNADFKKIASLKLELSSGRVCLVYSHLSDLAKRAKTGVNKSDIDVAQKMYPSSKVFLAINCFQYEVKFVAKDERGVDITATIPTDTLKIILPKIGINIQKTDDITMSGKLAYVGFNGGLIKFSDVEVEEEPVPGTLEERISVKPYSFRSLIEKPSMSMLDITKEVKVVIEKEEKPVK